MGQKTKIEWTEHSWNPWVGCTQISPGCDNCYMFREQRRWGNDPNNIRRTSHRTFTGPLRWKEPAHVFTCSWSDFFIKAADEWREEAWDIIRRTPHLTYQILTKRPALIRSRLPSDWGYGWKNVWIGVSVENHHFGWRVRELASIPARVRFVSYEPAVGPVDWREFQSADGKFTPIDWIIVGGESGPGARPFRAQWAREAIAFGDDVGVPVFIKQMGEHAFDGEQCADGVCEDLDSCTHLAPRRMKLEDRKGGEPSEWPAYLRRRELPEAA